MGAAARAINPATMADLEALPDNVKGELIGGVLYTQPRPRAKHQNVISLVDHELFEPYRRGRRGPGGWWILPEPGIELPGASEISPDIAGWQRSRMPDLPDDEPIRVVPDWICEVYTTRTRKYVLETKQPFYAQVGVRWSWLIDLTDRTLTVSRLHDGKWLEDGFFGGDQRVLVRPFDAAEMDLASFWSGKVD